MISLRNFALRRGERLLLSDVDLTMHAGYRVGVVGRNGTGKSSLFAAIRNEIEADKGDIDLPGKVRIASVAQETPSPDPAIEFVLAVRGGRAALRPSQGLGRRGREAWRWPTTGWRVNGYDASAGRQAAARIGFPAIP